MLWILVELFILSSLSIRVSLGLSSSGSSNFSNFGSFSGENPRSESSGDSCTRFYILIRLVLRKLPKMFCSPEAWRSESLLSEAG